LTPEAEVRKALWVCEKMGLKQIHAKALQALPSAKRSRTVKREREAV